MTAEQHPCCAVLRGQISQFGEQLLELQKQNAVLERMRPAWAQGHDTASIAAQVNTAALCELWALLGVTNQTAAIARLHELLGAEGK